jgi:hypothetical protein
MGAMLEKQSGDPGAPGPHSQTQEPSALALKALRVTT